MLKLQVDQGVIKDIPDNSKVMGYPAKNIREFLRENR
jgi:UDP-3-O-[3-hydroxymyristoyl] glucosamine N-acyltransferase